MKEKKKLVLASLAAILTIVFAIVLMIYNYYDGSKPGDLLYGIDKNIEENKLKSLEPYSEEKAVFLLEISEERAMELQNLNTTSFRIVQIAWAQDNDTSTETEILNEIDANLEEVDDIYTQREANGEDVSDLATEISNSTTLISTILSEVATFDSDNTNQEAIFEASDTLEDLDDSTIDELSETNPERASFKANRRIEKAEAKIQRTRSRIAAIRDTTPIDEINNNLDIALSYLAEAKTNFENSEFRLAYLNASEAYEHASLAGDLIPGDENEEIDGELIQVEARQKIQRATRQISEIESEDSTLDLGQAKNLLEEAQTAYDNGDYALAKNLAQRARKLARAIFRGDEIRMRFEDEDEDEVEEEREVDDEDETEDDSDDDRSGSNSGSRDNDVEIDELDDEREDNSGTGSSNRESGSSSSGSGSEEVDDDILGASTRNYEKKEFYFWF